MNGCAYVVDDDVVPKYVTVKKSNANSKLFEVVTGADVDVEKHVNDSLVQIW